MEKKKKTLTELPTQQLFLYAHSFFATHTHNQTEQTNKKGSFEHIADYPPSPRFHENQSTIFALD
jgi:hypothetical protein